MRTIPPLPGSGDRLHAQAHGPTLLLRAGNGGSSAHLASRDTSPSVLSSAFQNLPHSLGPPRWSRRVPVHTGQLLCVHLEVPQSSLVKGLVPRCHCWEVVETSRGWA